MCKSQLKLVLDVELKAELVKSHLRMVRSNDYKIDVAVDKTASFLTEVGCTKGE